MRSCISYKAPSYSEYSIYLSYYQVCWYMEGSRRTIPSCLINNIIYRTMFENLTVENEEEIKL
jgi:hypothetical protein